WVGSGREAKNDAPVAGIVTRDVADLPGPRAREAVRRLRRICRMRGEPREAYRHAAANRFAGREYGAGTEEQRRRRLAGRRPLAKLSPVRRETRATSLGVDDEERKAA